MRRRRALLLVALPLLYLAAWTRLWQLPPFASQKHARALTGLPVPYSADVLRPDRQETRFGNPYSEQIVLRLSSASFARAETVAMVRGFQWLPPNATEGAANALYRREGSADGPYREIVLDTTRKTLTVYIVMR